MIKEIITLLNMDEWHVGDEYIDIAKGMYSLPTNYKEAKNRHKRRKK